MNEWSVSGPSKPGLDAPEGGDYAVICDGQIIGEAFFRSSPQHTHDAYGNARLFAAAPNLLAALTDLLAAMDDGSEEPTLVRARAALAKSEGRS